MSRSIWTIGIDFNMLDGRSACVPSAEDFSCGHKKFGTRRRVRMYGPSSSVFDGIGETKVYNEDTYVEMYVRLLLDELTSDNGEFLRSMVRSCLQQAKGHCDVEHADVRLEHSGTRCPEHDPATWCDCDCHGRRILLHNHACCEQCPKCGFRTRCACEQCVPTPPIP